MEELAGVLLTIALVLMIFVGADNCQPQRDNAAQFIRDLHCAGEQR